MRDSLIVHRNCNQVFFGDFAGFSDSICYFICLPETYAYETFFISNYYKSAETLGAMAATQAKAAGISEAVFDRGGFSFHGKLKALADSARKNGIKI